MVIISQAFISFTPVLKGLDFKFDEAVLIADRAIFKAQETT